MTNTTSYFRATTPGANAQMGMESLADEAASARLRRHTLLQGASTVDELIAMISDDYRSVLAEPLKGISALAAKLGNCRSILQKWLQHQAAGTYPPHVRSKAPELQLTKEFGSESAAVESISALTEIHLKYLREALAASIKAKQDEVAHLEAALTPASLYNELQPIISTRAEQILVRTKLPDLVKNAEGILVLNGWLDNSAAKSLAFMVIEDCVVYAFRVISITEALLLRNELKFTKKKALQHDADVAMADATKPGPSINALIEKAVAKRLLQQPKGKGKVSNLTLSLTPTDPVFSLAPGQEGWQETQGHCIQETPCQTDSQGQSRQEVAGGQTSAEGKGQSLAFRYDMPATYPDWLLTVPLPAAINYIILNTPVNVIEASQFKYHVHRSPGVKMPEDIEFQLSVGMKYMFHSPRNKALLRDAWEDFANRIRWRIYHSFTKINDHDVYDPDYEVPHVTPQGPKLPAYLEYGLKLGRSFVNNTISKIPLEDENLIFKSLAPSPRLVQEFLISNNYVVTNTDKNLGIAVSERTWIRDKCLELLSDTNNYQVVSPMMMNAYCNQQCTEMELLANYADSYLHCGPQLGKFLRHRITVPGTQHVLPVFHGIPKIHKEPVKMRPIVPCHSAIQNPAAKYISKNLKPIIKSAPAILHGSKDLAIKLSQIKLIPRRQFFIVTGDVVAFYPNIPLEHCLDIAVHMYEEFNFGGPATTPEQMHLTEMFIRCLNVANKNLIMRFEDTLYRQVQGLAMGIACAPDLANLYGWYHERKLKILEHPLIPFYGRYIDDCCAIVYASTEAEALQIISAVKFDGCTIEWNASPQYQVFLDMTLYVDEHRKLQHMPYRKSRSHQERIPWISHHPLDVKRGTFIGEMSRLSTLCSLYSHYIDAIKSLVALYVKRGYPQDLVNKWVSDNFKERWNKRLAVRDDPGAPEDVLVLKSTFNSAWNYFSAKELGDTVLGYWRQWLTAAEADAYNIRYPKFSSDTGDMEVMIGSLCTSLPTADGQKLLPDVRKINILNRRMIVSRKRTKNLFDLTSLWKKTVITQLEHDATDPDRNSMDVDDDESASDSDQGDPGYVFQTLGYN